MSNLEDCRIGKELKQSTCRYVKECKRGWTRNDKFICRKTNRRLVSPKKFTTSDPSKAKRASRKVDSAPKSFTSANPGKAKSASKKSFTSANPRKAKSVVKLSAINEGNDLSPSASSRSTPNKTFTKLKSAKSKSKKYKVGNTFMYVHPDGHKEKATVTRLGNNDRLELHIPSLATNWANHGRAKFVKNQRVFYIYKTGAKELGVIKKVYDGEYDVQLSAPPRIKRIKEKNLRSMFEYKKIDKFPYYVLKYENN